jgi:hypothetical protein
MDNPKDPENVHGDGQRRGDESPSETTPDATSRRTFLRKVGAVAFSALIVDATTDHASASCGCGGGVTDDNCASGVSDLNCGVPQDHSDTDESCSSSSGWSDENCYIVLEEGAHDEDENCTAANNHTDNACGDCNDNHDSDEHCAVGGTSDSDQMCGHQHYNQYPMDTDDNCANDTTVTDVGCGYHDNGFGGGSPVTDADDNCYETLEQPDQNCTNQAHDAYCETQQYTTSPDESCNVSTQNSTDEACMQEFDSDEHCNSGTDSDEHCYDGWVGHDSDEHCGVGGDTDEACSVVPWDTDNS